MTNEEAIKEIKDASDSEVRYGDKDNHYDKVMKRVEAFDMAIKVLEQRLDIHDTCKKCVEFSNFKSQLCEDCISREQAIRATYGFERYTGIDEAPYEYAESILRDLPSITPTITDVENNYNIGYNCGYADAMFDISEESDSE